MNTKSFFAGIAIAAALFSAPASAISTSYDADRDTILPVNQSIHSRVQSLITSIRARQSVSPVAQAQTRLGWIFSGSVAGMSRVGSLSRIGSSNSRLAGVLSKLSSLSRGAFSPAGNVSPAPEPEIYALLALGLAMVVGFARRSRRAIGRG
jgi:hypothetical protein